MDRTTISSPLNATNLRGSENFFSWYDYIFFSTMLAISGGIGIYFGCFGKKQATTKEYLMGGKQMKVIPIAISLVASHTSGVTLLALPADVYVFGATYWLGVFSMGILTLITVKIFLPVFYRLQLTSTYEYLGLRFDKRTRKLSSFLFAVAVFLYLPIVIYIPSLAFAAATGIDVHIITPVVCSVCIFYTTIGGIKALVWSDTLQFSITTAAVISILLMGIRSLGGFGNMWYKAMEMGRLDVFDFDLHLTKRETVWAIVLGLSIHWVAHTSVNQGCTQKFLSVSSLKKSKRAVILYCSGMVIMKTLTVLCGLTMSAKYSNCDPFTTKRIASKDQLLPFFVLDVAGSIPGLSGLFIAGVFSASLSTLSANLNSLAGTIYEDFLKSLLTKRDKHNAGIILKLLVVIIGAISTLLVYIVEKLGGLLAVSIGMGSVAHGPLLGMFVLGVFFPRANSKGAFYGALTSMVLMSVVVGESNYYKSKGFFKYPHKPISVSECNFPVNSTLITAMNATKSTEDILPIFRISFYWYTAIGTTICVIIGLIISYLSEENDPPVAKELLTPVIHRFLPKGKHPDKMTLKKNGVTESPVITTTNGIQALDMEEQELLKRQSARLEKLRKKSIIADVIDD